ncbi:MAG TPA: C25 family cysteine peptidase, partial [Planctomycetaceae bacterium]|nr:C25 family cysteine peptidase [Planctomycetaceae bacterium]
MKRRMSFELLLLLGAALAFVEGVHQVAVADDPNARLPRLFLIVAPERFHAALVPYVNFKKQIRPTTLVSLEKVLESSSGVDDPERLKRFLYDAWRNRRLGYVLLVGDVDVMPVRYIVLDRIDPAAFDYAFYPSDLYYADLAKANQAFDDWNGSKQGIHAQYFGEIHGEKNKRGPINFDQIDYRPEIAVGRWPASTVEQVSTIASKSMEYEQSVREGTHPGLRRAEIFHVGGWVDLREPLSGLVRHLPSGWRANKYLFDDQQRQYGTSAPDEPHVIDALNRGAGLFVHVGHGCDHALRGCLDKKNLPEINNGDRLPVMISVSCGSGIFAPLPPYDPYVDIYGNEHAGTDHKQELFHAPPPPPSPYQTGKYNR